MCGSGVFYRRFTVFIGYLSLEKFIFSVYWFYVVRLYRKFREKLNETMYVYVAKILFDSKLRF